MKIVISSDSAVRFWRLPQSKRACAVPSQLNSLAEAGAPVQLLSGLDVEAMGLTDPLHVLIPSRSAKTSSKHFRAHVHSRQLPPGSLYRIADSVYIVSPELTFFQAGKLLSFPALLEFGMQLCGMYALDSDARRGFQQGVPPLTSTDRLQRYASSLIHLNKRSPSVRALNWLADGSASPMESKLELLLCLPPREGGYGIPLPVLNRALVLPKGAASMLGQSVAKPDLLWESHRLCVEYDSDSEHTGSHRIAEDAERRDVLTYLGYTTIVVTRMQLQNPRKFHHVATQIAKLLGKRLHIDNENWLDRHRLLRGQLFPWRSW